MNRFAANSPDDWEEKLDQLTDHADFDEGTRGLSRADEIKEPLDVVDDDIYDDISPLNNFDEFADEMKGWDR